MTHSNRSPTVIGRKSRPLYLRLPCWAGSLGESAPLITNNLTNTRRAKLMGFQTEEDDSQSRNTGALVQDPLAPPPVRRVHFALGGLMFGTHSRFRSGARGRG